MPLPAPNLDDRTFKQLVDEARQRIPRYTPEWTNFNDSDPGMTLVKLQAWLTETILYRLNQVPDLNYVKFLDLLNITPAPAVAAHAELTFKLKKLNDPNDPLVVSVPKNTQVGVDDPELQQELIFETDRTLTAVNAALAAVIVPGDGNTRELASDYDVATAETTFARTFQPFGAAPRVDGVCLFGFIVRPFRRNREDYSLDRFPAVELDLTVMTPEVGNLDAQGGVIAGPMSMQSLFPAQVKAEAQSIVWEAYYGIHHQTDLTALHDDVAWRRLNVQDGTAGLTRSGHVYLEVPGGMSAVPFDQLSRDFWRSLSLTKPPTTASELADDISTGLLAPEDLAPDVWRNLGVPALTQATLDNLLGDPVAHRAAIVALLRPLSLSFNRVETKVWTDASDAYDLVPFPYELSWLRARLTSVPEDAPQVVAVMPNTVAATAAVTRFEEVLGTSNARPSQSFRLSKSPILVDQSTSPPSPDLVLEIRTGSSDDKPWTAVPDFFGQGADAQVYVLNPNDGTIAFGDGIHGEIPIAAARIVVSRYRYGGGAVGNAGPGTVTKLKSAVPNLDKVTNIRAASGGGDAESLEEAKLRAPHDLRHRDRAVTADDFADLAKQTPGVRVHRAYALPLTRADRSTEPAKLVPNQPGAVTVVVLTEKKDSDLPPQPSEDELRLICDHLNQRRLVTTELYVAGPRYLYLTEVSAEVSVSRQSDLKATQDAIRDRLLTYFHPLRGGEDGTGWPFGSDIYFGHVYRQLLGIAGVTRVQCLTITPPAGTEVCDDYISVPDGSLVWLPRTVIDVKVTYDTVL